MSHHDHVWCFPLPTAIHTQFYDKKVKNNSYLGDTIGRYR